MLLVLAVLAGLALGEDASLTMLTDEKARCMDGTLSGYYFRAASASENATKWVLELEGGGECTTETRCKGALDTPLGSSKYFPQSTWFNFYNKLSPANPLASWNHVFLPYCSQDLWTGQVREPSNSTYNMYFSGHLVFQAVLDALDAHHSLQSASQIVLSGESAGGIGVWPNLDFLAQRYPHARVIGAPIAGFYFFADPYTGPNHTSSGLADFREPAWPQHAALWDSFVDADCAAAHPTWFCVLANNTYPYITSEVFATQSFSDQVVLQDHDWVPSSFLPREETFAYVERWSHNMSVATAPLVASNGKKGAVFGAACHIHTSFSESSPIVNGLNYYQAFARWFSGDVTGAAANNIDHCGIFCNPTCPQPNATST